MKHNINSVYSTSLQCSFVDAGPSCDTSSSGGGGDGSGETGGGKDGDGGTEEESKEGQGENGRDGGDEQQLLDRSVVNRSIRKLVTSIHHRTTSLSLFQSATLQPDACPDIRWGKRPLPL